jgi:formylglycine-generating enzyme required for sulfatase activity
MITLAAFPVQAAKRVALVIGNNDYATLPNLNNAKKDAEGMAAKLRGLGFDVILKTNAGSRTIGRALADFENRLAKADVALVFYAGHGIQANGKNHLIPSDANIEVEEDLRFESVDAQEFLQAMNRAGTPLNIVILDACRDNPLPRRSRSAARGLAIPAAPAGIKGTAIVYSAAPGQTAQDGPKGGHGIFTGALLKVLNEPGLKLEDVFKRTARRVASLTRGKQDPWINSSVKGDFYFKPGNSSGPKANSADNEGIFWNSIKDSADPDMFKEYLRQYPRGSFAGLAWLKVKKLKATKVAVITPPVPVVPSAATPAVGVYPQRFKPGTAFKDCPECPEMVVIPAGSFRMGDLSGNGSRDEKPVHTVHIPRPIAVGKFEVTQAEYRAVVGLNPSRFKSDRNPVEKVSWDDAQKFAKKLSSRLGKKYRLLSEAEWEYAARAGTTTKYSWGNNSGLNNANCAGCGSNWDNKETAAIGSFKANDFGLHDMLGNVWEWVADCSHENYRGAPTDGSVWVRSSRRSSANCQLRILRGNSWRGSPRSVRSAYREMYANNWRSDDLGFRIARDLSATELRASATTPSKEIASLPPQSLQTRQRPLTPFAAAPESQYEYGEILVIDPPNGFETPVLQMKYSIIERIEMSELGIKVYRLKTPNRMTLGQAKQELLTQFPSLNIDANHLFELQ